MALSNHAFVVILAGGGGTRLWPKSRNKTPKQFLKLYSENSLMQDTYKRARLLTDPEHIIVISNKDYITDVREQLPELPEKNIIGEPQKRETAPAMLLGALIAYKRDPEAVVMNLASDHILSDEAQFIKVAETALTVASKKVNLIAVGITPTFPHTGMGYIQIGEKLDTVGGLPVYTVTDFKEKPDVETAKKFLATGKYFWNACNYVWSVETLLASFRKYSPEILAALEPLLSVIDTPDFAAAADAAYAKVEKIAIDYAISEKADNLALIPGDFGWNDIGDWKVVYDLQKKDESNNVILQDKTAGRVVAYDSRGNLVHSNTRLIALVGMENTVVVDTGEILLVMPKDRSQDVKKIVEELKKESDTYL